jgi:filamentous hemagglutinin
MTINNKIVILFVMQSLILFGMIGGGAVLQGLGGSVVRGIEASRALLSEGKMVLKEGVKNTVSVVSGRVDRLLQRPVFAPVTRPTPTPVVARVADPATGGTGVTGPPFKMTKHYWSEGVEVNGKKVFQRNDLIDPNAFHPKHGTNLEAMKQGKAPIGPDGKPINLHHTTQDDSGSIAEMTASFHQKNTKIIHTYQKLPEKTIEGFEPVNRARFDAWRDGYWPERAKDFEIK